MTLEERQAMVEALLEDRVYNFNEATPLAIEDGQPKYASWVSFDVDLTNYAIEETTIISYKDAESMQKQMLKLVKEVFTNRLLQFVRDGTIENLSFRIGPRTISSRELNQENDIEKLVFDK